MFRVPRAPAVTFCRWVIWLACAGRCPPQEIASTPGYAESFPGNAQRASAGLLALARSDLVTCMPQTPDCRELRRPSLLRF